MYLGCWPFVLTCVGFQPFLFGVLASRLYSGCCSVVFTLAAGQSSLLLLLASRLYSGCCLRAIHRVDDLSPATSWWVSLVIAPIVPTGLHVLSHRQTIIKIVELLTGRWTLWTIEPWMGNLRFWTKPLKEKKSLIYYWDFYLVSLWTEPNFSIVNNNLLYPNRLMMMTYSRCIRGPLDKEVRMVYVTQLGVHSHKNRPSKSRFSCAVKTLLLKILRKQICQK